jgi:hypothetical protein
VIGLLSDLQEWVTVLFCELKLIPFAGDLIWVGIRNLSSIASGFIIHVTVLL